MSIVAADSAFCMPIAEAGNRGYVDDILLPGETRKIIRPLSIFSDFDTAKGVGRLECLSFRLVKVDEGL